MTQIHFPFGEHSSLRNFSSAGGTSEKHRPRQDDSYLIDRSFDLFPKGNSTNADGGGQELIDLPLLVTQGD